MNKRGIFAISLLLIAILVSSCVMKTNSNSSRQRVTQKLAIEPFERLVVDIAGDVTYTQGHSTKLTLYSSNKKLAEAVKVSNQNGTLYISFGNMDEISEGIDIDNELKLEISSPDLISVEIKGTGQFETQGPLDTDTLLLQVKGKGEIETDKIVCDRLQADMLGAGKMELGPIEAQQCQLNLNGVGKIDADFTKCDYLNCQLLGLGRIELTGRVHKWDSNIAGAGIIDSDELQVYK